MQPLGAGFGLLMCWASVAAPSYLNGGTHASFPYALNAFNAGLGQPLSTAFPAGVNGDYVPDPAPLYSAMPAAMLNASGTYLAGNTTTPPINHAPYALANLSFCCWSTDGAFLSFVPMDTQLYNALQTQNAILAVSYGGSLALPNPRPLNTQPPIVTTSGSATNSGDGATGGGIEFGLSPSYLGLNTSADSFISAEIAGFLLAMQYQHPTWNLQDIKGALRQTASNWATGYNPTAYGYGLLDYASATAVTSPAAVFLQPPEVGVQQFTGSLLVTLYPYRQARRVQEVLYSVNPSYVWPLKSEYTAADLVASGGTLLFTSNGALQTSTFTFVPLVSGSVTLLAFTTDGTGAYSRVESFSAQTFSLTVATMCH